MRANVDRSRLDRTVYGLIHRNPGWGTEEVSSGADCSPAEVEEACDRLLATGLLSPAPTARCGFATVEPEAALTRLFTSEERQAAAHAERMARIRSDIAALTVHFADLRNERRAPVEVETLATPALVNSFLEDAGSMVRSRMRSMHPGGPPPEDVIDEMLLRDKEMAGRNIEVEVLYQRRAAEVPYVAAYLMDAARRGREARTAEFLPIRMILFDDDLAVLPINPADSSEGALAVHGRALMATLHAFYDHCWHNATLPRRPQEGRASRPALDSQELIVVRLLADGVKDEVIARHLGVSSRTLSRLISGLLERLGVQTRFQAALRIAELDLLA
ncbi:helix-turn-helix transcriptional regulator [Streptomyces sp. NBC_00083]|uniref:helix-turn-helix transcriptional regulator n=1 Tax=Streptomyces sp. NBC_00083 TaxID=2975647 RepID=UPI0022526013|nr:helix-turn-helix transcriptional regulator [Streptomyces sp. NBC_00083]MCX5383351.1 helix-turn-helix transcriptional regulator [Streptomyces sp. NBC_00083]